MSDVLLTGTNSTGRTRAFSSGATIPVTIDSNGANYVRFGYQDYGSGESVATAKFGPVGGPWVDMALGTGALGDITGAHAEVWELFGTWAAGSYEVVFTLTGGSLASGTLVRAFQNVASVVHQTKTTDTAMSISSTIASQVHGLVVDFVTVDNTTGVLSAASSQSNVIDDSYGYGGQEMLSGTLAGASPSVTSAWDNTVNSDHVVQIISALAPTGSVSVVAQILNFLRQLRS